MRKDELIKELVADVKQAFRRDLVDYYEVNQAEHLQYHFELTKGLDSQWEAFVRCRCENADRFPDSFRNIYQRFQTKWKELNND